MEKKVAGLTVTGNWSDVVEHGEKVTVALIDAGVDTEADWFVDWNEWRPKLDESHSNEMLIKTANQASEDVDRRVTEYVAGQDSLNRRVHRLYEVFRSLVSLCIRGVEFYVYKNFMTVLSPYYFDNEEINANLSYNNRENTYQLQVSIADDSLHTTVCEKIKSYNDSSERWHSPLGDEPAQHLSETEHKVKPVDDKKDPESMKDLNSQVTDGDSG